jgi:hypothetical protein
MSAAESTPGLCLTCRHSRRIESDRGSVFWQCQLSFTDPRFAKYPRLPVLQCSGYERIADSETGCEASTQY